MLFNLDCYFISGDQSVDKTTQANMYDVRNVREQRTNCKFLLCAELYNIQVQLCIDITPSKKSYNVMKHI